ncbi:hypothetical protein ABPG77_004863 [Micractinium sp. CCAP 211/92]
MDSTFLQAQPQGEALHASVLPLDPPKRVVGFQGRRSFSSNDLPPAGAPPVVTCALSLSRQPSEGSLKRLLCGGGGAAAPRQLAPVVTRRRAPPRLKSFILVAGPGQHDCPVTPVTLAQGSESGGRLQISGLRRTGSMPLDITPGIRRSQTTPEGLPDMLVVAGPAPGHGFADSSPTSSINSSGAGSSFGGAASKTVPSKRPLHTPQGSGGTPIDSGGSPGSTASFNTASSASLMSGSALLGLDGLTAPVTPAAAVAAAARRRRQQHAAATVAQQLQARSCSFKDLFDAQAEATTAQAQVHALQAALQRKDEELARLQLELAAVAAERDQLRMNVGGGALANAAASAPAPLRLRPRHRSAGPRVTPGVPEAEPQRRAGAIDSPFASALPFALE